MEIIWTFTILQKRLIYYWNRVRLFNRYSALTSSRALSGHDPSLQDSEIGYMKYIQTQDTCNDSLFNLKRDYSWLDLSTSNFVKLAAQLNLSSDYILIWLFVNCQKCFMKLIISILFLASVMIQING